MGILSASTFALSGPNPPTRSLARCSLCTPKARSGISGPDWETLQVALTRTEHTIRVAFVSCAAHVSRAVPRHLQQTLAIHSCQAVHVAEQRLRLESSTLKTVISLISSPSLS